LRATEVLFTHARGFDPLTAENTFRLAASDYLDPTFLPQLVAQIKSLAPMCKIDIYALSDDVHYYAHLAQGDIDLVIGNWLKTPEDLHMGRLFGDEVVCMVSRDHPAVRRGWTHEAWLAAEHVAPTPMHPGALGVIDDYLHSMGLTRNVSARCAHFSLIPAMVETSLLVLTTGRQYCERFMSTNRLKILPCPIKFPRLMYYQLWHERTHTSKSAAWLRDRVKSVASTIRKQ
jgi:DNA-binding transcriptional LysR family regulator